MSDSHLSGTATHEVVIGCAFPDGDDVTVAVSKQANEQLALFSQANFNADVMSEGTTSKRTCKNFVECPQIVDESCCASNDHSVGCTANSGEVILSTIVMFILQSNCMLGGCIQVTFRVVALFIIVGCTFIMGVSYVLSTQAFEKKFTSKGKTVVTATGATVVTVSAVGGVTVSTGGNLVIKVTLNSEGTIKDEVMVKSVEHGDGPPAASMLEQHDDNTEEGKSTSQDLVCNIQREKGIQASSAPLKGKKFVVMAMALNSKGTMFLGVESVSVKSNSKGVAGDLAELNDAENGKAVSQDQVVGSDVKEGDMTMHYSLLGAGKVDVGDYLGELSSLVKSESNLSGPMNTNAIYVHSSSALKGHATSQSFMGSQLKDILTMSRALDGFDFVQSSLNNLGNGNLGNFGNLDNLGNFGSLLLLDIEGSEMGSGGLNSSNQFNYRY